MKKVVLAEFNREYHNHALFGDAFAFNEAFENFLEEIVMWKAQTGIEFECEIVSEKNHMLMCNVTKVVAIFDDDTDYAMYQMHMPKTMKATDITGDDNSFYFTGWIDSTG